MVHLTGMRSARTTYQHPETFDGISPPLSIRPCSELGTRSLWEGRLVDRTNYGHAAFAAGYGTRAWRVEGCSYEVPASRPSPRFHANWSDEHHVDGGVAPLTIARAPGTRTSTRPQGLSDTAFDAAS